MGIMTGGASATSIQISYSTEDGGIATEEILGFGGSEFLAAELEDVEEYPVTRGPPQGPIQPKEFDNNNGGTRCVRRAYELELKMVTLVTDKNYDGVRIVEAEEEMVDDNSPIRPHSPSPIPESDFPKSSPETEETHSEASPLANVAEEAQELDDETSTPEQTTIESCLRKSIELVSCNEYEQNGDAHLEEHLHEKEDQSDPSAHHKQTNRVFETDEPSLEYHTLTSYDGPPILSPNYETEDHNMSTVVVPDDGPPALTKQANRTRDRRRSRGRPSGLKRKRKRSSRSRKPKTPKVVGDHPNNRETDFANGKSCKEGHFNAPALHRTNVPVVIPHSSAEIQERVKNRQRKPTQSYGTILDSSISISELMGPIKPVQKLRSRARKLSSRSSTSSEKTAKKDKSQTGLFIVEKILKKGIINGRPYFFVKWLNYPSSRNTWEPEENFSLDLITAYEKKVAETGQLVKVFDGVNVNQPPAEFRTAMRPRVVKAKETCPGCLSYPRTFVDKRKGLNGFDEGLTYHKVLESFILEEERCALVEFDEKHSLELIPMTIVNERVKAEINLH